MSQSESEIESKCRQCRKIALKLKKALNGRPRDTPNKRNYCPFNLEHWYLHDVKGRLGTVDGKDIEVARQQQQLLHINTFTGCTRSKQKVPSYSTTLCRRCMLFPGSTTLGMSDFHNQSSTNSTNSKSGTAQPAESTKFRNGHGQQLEKLHEAPQIKWALLWLRITQN